MADLAAMVKMLEAQKKQMDILQARIKDMEGKNNKNAVDLVEESDVEGEVERRRSPRLAKNRKGNKMKRKEAEEVLLLLRCLFSLSLPLRCLFSSSLLLRFFFFVFALAFFFSFLCLTLFVLFFV